MNGRMKDVVLSSALAFSLTACNGLANNSPTEGNQIQVVETGLWDTKLIPANNKFIPIENARLLQTYDMGLRRLYIANSSDTQMVSIFSIWDTTKINLAKEATFSFQDFRQRFSTDDVPNPQFVDISVPNWLRQYFLRESSSTLSDEVRLDRNRALFGPRKRPDGDGNILIFRADGMRPMAVEMNFSFEQVTSDLQKLVR